MIRGCSLQSSPARRTARVLAMLAFLALGTSSGSVHADTAVRGPDGAIVSLTFDDGLATTYQQAAPILARHGFAGTVYVTTDFVGRQDRMTWQQLRDIQDRLGWEVGSHAVTHPELPTLDEEAIRREVSESKRRLEAEGLRVHTFASPHGAYDDRVLAEVARNYSAHRGFWERSSFNRWPYEPLRLRVQSVETRTPLESVLGWIDAAVAQAEWLVLVFHELTAEPSSTSRYCTTLADLERIARYLRERDVRVATVRDVIGPDGTAALLDETFVDELSGRGWDESDDATVRRDDSGRGAFPDDRWSVELRPVLHDPARLVGPPVSVAVGRAYRVEAFVDRRRLVDGDISVQVEELGQTGSSLGRSVLGWVGAPLVQCRWVYTPRSPDVDAIRLSVVARGSGGQAVYVDNLRVVEVEPGPPTQAR